MSARAAEEAIEQAGTLLDGVRRLADELAQAANRLVEARAEIEADLAEARLLPGAELAAAAARAEAALTSAGREVGSQDGSGGGDPLAALRRLDEAGTALDEALADAQEAREAGERAAAQLDRTLLAARSGIAAASDFIATRRGAVGSDARTRLAEAQRHLDTAVGLARSAPVDALREAQQADALAQEALRLARDDVQRWSPPRGGGGSSGIDLGSLVLGGILLGGRSGGFGGGGSRRRPRPGRRVRRGLLPRQLRRLGHPRPPRRRGPLLTPACAALTRRAGSEVRHRPTGSVAGWTACARC